MVRFREMHTTSCSALNDWPPLFPDSIHRSVKYIVSSTLCFKLFIRFNVAVINTREYQNICDLYRGFRNLDADSLIRWFNISPDATSCGVLKSISRYVLCWSKILPSMRLIWTWRTKYGVWRVYQRLIIGILLSNMILQWCVWVVVLTIAVSKCSDVSSVQYILPTIVDPFAVTLSLVQMLLLPWLWSVESQPQLNTFDNFWHE